MRTSTRCHKMPLAHLLLTLAVALAALAAQPASALALSTSPEGYAYESQGNGVAITGYSGAATALSIPATLDGLPVTSIADDAFSQNHAVTEVTIHEGVTSIGNRAFNDCTSLAKISLPSTLTNIGKSAFYTCSSLTSIELPNSLTTIGDYAFMGCLGLTSITIPGSVRSWGTASFGYCNSLASVTVANGVAEIPERAFKTCEALTTVSLASSVKTVGRRAFEFCSKLSTCDLSHVEKFGYRAFACSNTPDGLAALNLASATEIDEEAFSGQSAVASIALSRLRSIGKKAFAGTLDGGGTVTLPASTAELADGAFQGCNLSRIDVDATCNAYKSVDGVVYTADGSTLVAVPATWSPTGSGNADSGSSDSDEEDAPVTFEPAAGTTKIAGGAFAGVQNIEKLVLPDTVTELGEEAFMDSSMSEVVLSANLTAIPARAFYDASIASVTIPGSVRSIGESAFAGSKGLSMLESATFEEGVESIGERAFADCSSLTTLSLPSTLTEVGALAFYDTRALESVTLAAGGTLSLKDGNLLADGGTTLVYAFPTAADADANTYTVPDGVTRICKLALEAQDSRTTHIPDSVTTFDEMSVGYSYSTKGTYSRASKTKFFGSASNTALTSYLKENNLAFFTAEPAASCSELTLATGQTGSFTLSGSTSDFVVYASSNNSVASIDENGTVTAVGGGEADVFACVSQIYYSAHVTVTGEAAADPYADYVNVSTEDEAKTWASAYEAYNNGTSPRSATTPSIHLYTTDNYTAINSFLDAADFQKRAEAQYGSGEYGEFEQAGINSGSELGQYAVNQNTVVWSGLEHGEFIPGGISDLSNVTALIGQEVTFGPITSTTLLRKVAVRFASTGDTPTLLQVMVPAGTTQGAYIGTYSAVPDEYELTIAPNTKFRVLDAGVAYFPYVNPLGNGGTDEEQEMVPYRYIKVLLLDDDDSSDASGDGDDPDDGSGDSDSKGDDKESDKGASSTDEQDSGGAAHSSGSIPATGDTTAPATLAILASAILACGLTLSRRRG